MFLTLNAFICYLLMFAKNMHKTNISAFNNINFLTLKMSNCFVAFFHLLLVFSLVGFKQFCKTICVFCAKINGEMICQS